ncbi:manganese efflux pump, partial [Bacillus velezensis]
MAWLLILGLAVSSSIDNLGVGMSYGIRKIKISHASNMMIAFICFVFSYIGIYFGKWISEIPDFIFKDGCSAFDARRMNDAVNGSES